MLAFLLLLLVQGEAPAKTGGYVPTPSRAQALSPDSKELVFNLDDGTIRFLSLVDGKVRISASGFPTWIDWLAWSPDGEVVASIGRDGQVQLIRAKDAKIHATFATLPESTSPVWMSRSIDFVDGGKKLFLAGGASPVQILDRETGKQLAQFFLKSNTPITARCVSRDGLHLGVADRAGFFATYSARTGELESGPYRGPEPINRLAFDPDSTRLAVGGGDCKVRVVPLRPGVEGAVLSHCDDDLFGGLGIGWVEFSPDGKRLLSTSYSWHEIRLWDLAKNTEVWRYEYGGGDEGGVAARFSPDPSIVVASRGGLVLEAATGKLKHRFSRGRVMDVCRLEGFYAWSVQDGRLSVHDVRDGKLAADIALTPSTPR